MRRPGLCLPGRAVDQALLPLRGVVEDPGSRSEFTVWECQAAGIRIGATCCLFPNGAGVFLALPTCRLFRDPPKPAAFFYFGGPGQQETGRIKRSRRFGAQPSLPAAPGLLPADFVPLYPQFPSLPLLLLKSSREELADSVSALNAPRCGKSDSWKK